MKLSMSTEVDAPVEKVWSVICDVERWPEWTASMLKVDRLDAGLLAVGSRARVRQPKLPVAVWQVTALEPGRFFTWQAKGPGLLTVAGHEAEPLENGRTRATLWIDQRGPLAAITGRFWDKLTREYVTTELAGLKKRSEGGS